MKKKIIVALSIVMIASLTSCSGISDLGRNVETTEQISEESIEEGVIITYRIVDKNPSDKIIEETIENMSQRIKEYAGHSECVVNDDEITFGIELNPKEYDVEEFVYELGRSGELYILDEENYDLWSQGEEFEAALTGAEVKEATATMTTTSMAYNSYIVQLELTDKGTEKFADFTKANIGNSTYIIFDGELIMNPIVGEPIMNGQLVIQGLDSLEAAKKLAVYVLAGSLPLNLDLVDYEIIEAEE